MRSLEPTAPPVAPATVPAGAAAMAPVVGKETTTKKKRRRRRRAHPDDSRLYNLMLDVNALRSEVQRLEMTRDVMATRALVARENQRGAMLSTSARVFFAFRNGYQPQQWTPSEQDFVTGIFDEEVYVGATTGRHALFGQWRLYTELFRMETFEVESARLLQAAEEAGDDLLVEVRGAFNGRMTYDALAAVFPHVLGHPELERMLIGRVICCPLRKRLFFDRSGRISKYLVDVDMVAAISQLVGRSIELTATLMAHARINEASMIGTVEPGGEAGYDRDEEASSVSELGEGESSSPETDWTDARTDGPVSHRQPIAYILS